MDLSLQLVLDYYKKIINHYENGNLHQPEVVLPPVPEVSEDCSTLPSPKQYLLPSVILWDPLEQLDCFCNGLACPFPGHNEKEVHFLEPKKSQRGDSLWQAGSRPSLMPRQLTSSSWPTVLLSKIYICKSKLNHKTYIGHDPEILAQIPSSESHKTPFVLLHKTGFTKELCETVFSLAASGMSLVNIEQIICQQHMTNFLQCKAQFEEDRARCLSNVDPEMEEAAVLFPDYEPIGLPSMEMILGSLLDNYQEYKPYYRQRMTETSANVLLMGHFLKSSSHIGTVGPDGKKWVSMYDYIFTVMNENGQVIAWQATKGTCMEVTNMLLKNVHLRLKKQGADINLILTPDCCKHKEFITSIFGKNVQIKMDPKLASQRLEKKFKIRAGDHDHVATCLQEFALVFQRSTDLGTERNEETLSSDIILANLVSFISHWSVMKGENNERLLHDPAIRELEDIKKSVVNGCLSNIPAISGGKYISELREFVQPVLNKRFMSTDLAIPALTVLFYCWNENHRNGGTSISICSYKSALDSATFIPTTEQFGRIDISMENTENSLYTSVFLPYNPSTFLFSLLWDVNEEFCLADSELARSTSQHLNSKMLSKVLLLTENSYMVHQNLKSLYLEKYFPIDIWHYHLISCCIQIFSRNNTPVNGGSSKSTTLQEIVEMFGGALLYPDSEDDGFFVALIHSISSLLNSLESENPQELFKLNEHLNSLGCSAEELKISSGGVGILRQLVRSEWIKNKDRYSQLLASDLLEFTQEAEMINLLPLAAVRIFKLPMIIFTSFEHFPVVPVTTAERPIVPRCLYMAYSAAGYGSYYTVNLTYPHLSKPMNACRCGLGKSKSKDRLFCIHISGQYLTRCECFRSGKACSHLCRCFNCSNPHGTSTESRASQTSQNTRLRTKHKLQKIKKKSVNEKYESSWTERECLAFSYLIDALLPANNLTSGPAGIADTLLKEYCNLQEFCKGNMMLKQKSLDDIKQHLNYFSSGMVRFKTLFTKQTETNWTPVDIDRSDNDQLVVIVDSTGQVNDIS